MTRRKKEKKTGADQKEVRPGIFMVRERSRLKRLRPSVNLYVIAGSDGLVFDAGYGNRGSVRFFVKQFRRIGEICRARGEPFSVKRVLVSHAHPDHFAGLQRLRKKLGLSVLLAPRTAEIIRRRRVYRASYDARELERELLGRPFVKRALLALAGPVVSRAYELLYGTRYVPDPDLIVPEEGSISINGEAWRILSSPGHSDDHISLYDPAGGVLLAGDNVLGKIITWLGPPRSDLDAYRRTLEGYLALPKLEVVLGSHGGPVLHPERRIRSIIRWRAGRREDVLAVIRRAGPAGTTARGILEALYRRGDRILLLMAEGWVLLTLKGLLGEGAVLRLRAKGKVLFVEGPGR